MRSGVIAKNLNDFKQYVKEHSLPKDTFAMTYPDCMDGMVITDLRLTPSSFQNPQFDQILRKARICLVSGRAFEQKVKAQQ